MYAKPGHEKIMLKVEISKQPLVTVFNVGF